MRTHQFRVAVVVVVALAVPFGCGKDSDNGGATSAGSGGMLSSTGGQSTAGNMSRAGMGGRMTGSSGTGPTGCEGITPQTGDACEDAGIVCPNQLGSCVCERAGGQR